MNLVFSQGKMDSICNLKKLSRFCCVLECKSSADVKCWPPLALAKDLTFDTEDSVPQTLPRAWLGFSSLNYCFYRLFL